MKMKKDSKQKGNKACPTCKHWVLKSKKCRLGKGNIPCEEYIKRYTWW